MDAIPEEQPSTMSSNRSGIKMGYSGGAIRPLDPASVLASQMKAMSTLEEDEEESEWEHEVTADGSVTYIVPLSSSGAEMTATVPHVDKPDKKLSRLIRRRESKRDRNNVVLKTPTVAATSRKPNCESSDNDSSTYGQIKTFEAFFEASNLDQSVTSEAPLASAADEAKGDATEIHEVTLKFSAKQFKAQIPRFQMLLHGENPANRGLLLEALLGVIPEAKPSAKDGSSSNYGEIIDNSVVVAGLIPDGPAFKCGDKVRNGDFIRSLDGHHITLDSANTYLLHKLSKTSGSSSTMKVKLILQRPVGTRSPSRLPMAGRPFTETWTSIADSGAISMIISTGSMSEASPDLADILYQFPNQPSTTVRIRGIFTTLVQLLPDMLSSHPICSTLILSGSHLHGSHHASSNLYHAAYSNDGDELFIIVLPASDASDSVTMEVMRELKHFLTLKYGSLMRAALAPCDEVDDVIGKRIRDAIAVKPPCHSNFLMDIESLMEASAMLKLPEEIVFQVEDAMNQFESSDFQDFSDDFYDLPREFIIVGSCIFHRGLVVASHLSKMDLTDIKLWLVNNRAINLIHQQPVHRIVVWHELHKKGTNASGRKFLLVTGLGYQLLGVILEIGDCSSQPDGIVKPDPFYVDQAINTLEHLAEMGIPLVCEKWLALPHNPALIDVDSLFTAAAKVKKIDLKSAVHPQQPQATSGVVLKRTRSMDLSLSSSSSMGSASPKPPPNVLLDTYEMSTAFRGDDDEEGSSQWELPRSSRKSYINFYKGADEKLKGSGAPSISSNSDKSETESSDVVTYQISRLTVTQDNTLLQYAHIDVDEGILLTPFKRQSFGQLEGLLMDNFLNAVRIMHCNFRSYSSQRTGGGKNHKWSSKSLAATKEQGMLFRWSPIESLPTLSYWVCGRLFLTPDPKEFYVAYHESAPQQIVELAFRLAYGVL